MEEIVERNSGDYYVDFREFSTGGVELIIRVIRPMHDGQVRASADPNSWSNWAKANGIPVNIGRDFKSFSERPAETNKELNVRRALRRSKQQIRWRVREFGADRLFTLTYRGVMSDRSKLERDFKEFRRLVKKGWQGQDGVPDWRYVAVPEKHDSGGYHIHCAVKGWQKVKFLRACWFKALGGSGHETGDQTPGNVDVTTPAKSRWGTQRMSWKSSRLSSYITKYLSKTFDEDSMHNKRYWHSRSLKVPEKRRFILSATDLIAAIKEAAGILFFHYGQELDFTRSWLGRLEDTIWISVGEP